MSAGRARRMRGGVIAAVLVGAIGLGACATDSGVVTQRADAVNPDDPDPTPPTTDPDDPTPDTDPDDTTPGTTDPDDPTPPDTDPVDPPSSDLVDLGDAKEPRVYDDYLIRSLEDIEAWWSDIFPQLYGEEYVRLQGGIYAGYPERTDPIPGCAPDDETTYDELTMFAAFYCPAGDFMAYDDGEEGILNILADEYGPSILGVVMAHEYGHAVQERSGVLAQQPATILTEQQADCFAGAWAAHANRGETPGLEFNDEDIRIGIIAMITVRDPIGIDQFEPGGHGSAFDRVGAFQVGFSNGPERCVSLIDEPLPLMPNVFTSPGSNPDGNADFGYDAAQSQIAGFVAEDLNAFWSQALGVPELTVVPFDDPDEVQCDDVVGDPMIGTLLCPSTSQVFIDDPLARQRYEDFGDFAIGYMLGNAWAEAAQAQLGSPLAGEERELLTDCLTGAWAKTLVPDENGQNTAATAVAIEPGDLDEAIQTALVVGDDTSGEDILGSPFEKIASFREGVIGGVDACRALLD